MKEREVSLSKENATLKRYKSCFASNSKYLDKLSSGVNINAICSNGLLLIGFCSSLKGVFSQLCSLVS